MNTIKLDKAEIISKIMQGDTNEGHYVLAVASDGSASRIHWSGDRDQYCHCPDGWLHIRIPAVFGAGTSDESDLAEVMFKDMGRYDEAMSLYHNEDISFSDIAERFDADRWQSYLDESVDWYASAFLAACNGDGQDLDAPQPWGYSGDMYSGDFEANDPPAEFEWA